MQIFVLCDGNKMKYSFVTNKIMTRLLCILDDHEGGERSISHSTMEHFTATDLILVKTRDGSLIIRPVKGLLNDENCQLPTVRDLSQLDKIVNINELQVVEACCVGCHAGKRLGRC